MTEKETTQAEDLYNKYKGKVVEMYVGEKIGTQYYAEEDAEKRAYITGTIEGFMVKRDDGIHISAIFGEAKK